jgi:hypothetical protein
MRALRIVKYSNSNYRNLFTYFANIFPLEFTKRKYFLNMFAVSISLFEVCHLVHVYDSITPSEAPWLA